MRAQALLRRVAAMPAAEIRDRLTGTVRREAARLAHRARPAAWRREDLARALLPWTADVEHAITHLSSGRPDEAHQSLARHFAVRPRRWPVTPTSRDAVARAILTRLPDAAADAVRRADAIADGRFDLLGYRDLRFDAPGDGGVGRPEAPSVSGAGRSEIDWHRDPVHDRTAPRLFWSEVPYLDPACGDHKIIWELNRHQHFLTLGRAWALAGHRPARATFIRHLASWMTENPPLVGVNWASMLELAFRSISWIWALECFVEPPGRPTPDDGHPWLVDLLLGLDRQLHLVEQNLSTYFSPNTHLLGEALALYVAGRTLPELRRAPAWAALGRRILIEEMDRQIAPDGGHVERSFHYHRYTLDFYLLALTVARITRDDARPFTEAARRLARFARVVADDRGRLARIGDDDGGQLLPICGRDSADASDSLALAAWLLADPSLAVGPPPEETAWMSAGLALSHEPSSEPGSRPGLEPGLDPGGLAGTAIPSTTLGDTGYTVSRTARGDHLVFDCGPHGFLNGGHAHADALSLTLTVAGRPLIVDPGTACYTIDPATRDRFRSTRLHNTLQLDGQPQSQPAGPFHWASTAAGSRVAWWPSDTFDFVEGEHDGYAPARHRRAIFARPGCWVVADRVLAAADHDAALHWHLDPRWTVTPAAAGWVRADDGHGDPIWIGTPDGEIEMIRGGDGDDTLGWIAPAYGRVVPATTLRIHRRGQTPFALATVIVESARQPWVERLDAHVDGTRDGSSVALRLGVDDVAEMVVFGSTTPARGQGVHAPSARAIVSAGGVDTDAALVCCRAVESADPLVIAAVEASVVRTADGRALRGAMGAVSCKETVA